MSRKYKFRNPEAFYFITFTTVNWIDVFTRPIYIEILVDSLNYCIKNKGLIVYAWVIMNNHVHLVIESRSAALEDIMRDLKKHTSKTIIKAIEENPQESRKGWMLWMFERAEKKKGNNSKYQFGQQYNQPIELTVKAFYIDTHIDYIQNNPVEEGFVNGMENCWDSN